MWHILNKVMQSGGLCALVDNWVKWNLLLRLTSSVQTIEYLQGRHRLLCNTGKMCSSAVYTPLYSLGNKSSQHFIPPFTRRETNWQLTGDLSGGHKSSVVFLARHLFVVLKIWNLQGWMVIWECTCVQIFRFFLAPMTEKSQYETVRTMGRSVQKRTEVCKTSNAQHARLHEAILIKI